MKINLIVAVDEKNWIWKNWDLAWRISDDMKYFKKITSKTLDKSNKNAVVMWRKTWESIPLKYRPLPNRINCILSKNTIKTVIWWDLDENIIYHNSIDECINELKTKENIENIFIIWWANIYNQLLENDILDKLYITKVRWDHNCDVFLNDIPDYFTEEFKSEDKEENGIKYNFCVYKKVD